jgi:hypothetical protein
MMPWQLWLIFGLPLAGVLLVMFLRRGLHRSLSEDAGLRILEPTRRWDEWVNEHEFVDSDPAPRLRRHR